CGKAIAGVQQPDPFEDVTFWPETKKLQQQNLQGDDLVRLNRLVLEDSYPLEIAERCGARQWTRWAGTISSLVLLLLVGIVLFDHFRMDGQPFSLTQGISIWPTELIRVAATGLAVIFFFFSRSTLLRSKREWIRDYGLPAIMARKGVRKVWQDSGPGRNWGGLRTHST